MNRIITHTDKNTSPKGTIEQMSAQQTDTRPALFLFPSEVRAVNYLCTDPELQGNAQEPQTVSVLTRHARHNGGWRGLRHQTQRF